MKKNRYYGFRDTDGLLSKVDKGSRSSFIRKALQTQTLINQSAYSKEIEETNELITFYNNKIKTYDEELQQLKQETKNIIQLKNKTKDKLEKTMKEQNTRKTIVQQQKQIKNQEKLAKTRQEILSEIIKNTLKRRDNKTIPQINIDYMVKKGKYDNPLELKTDLVNHIKNLTEHDTLNDQKIFKKDIEYLKQLNRSKKHGYTN